MMPPPVSSNPRPAADQLPEDGLSRTSRAVALIRAELDRPCSPQGDPEAQRRLCAGMRPASGTLWSQIVARTRFFDRQVLDALAAGVQQVAICGAGYDDRALRFRTDGVRFFELDHPGTQADKARRLHEMGERPEQGGPTLVSVDFRSGDAGTALAACGHRADRATLFLCEGLLVYLDEPTILRLLSALHGRAAAGSRLAASLAVHREEADSVQVAAAANARRRSGATEPWRTILPVAQHLELLKKAGWLAEQRSDAAWSDPPGRSLLVVARPLAAPTAG